MAGPNQEGSSEAPPGETSYRQAVDFYRVGDLIRVVRELDGNPPPDTSGHGS